MVKKTVEYEDFDGQKRVEDFWFNFTEAELTEMEMSLNGGLSQLLQKIIDEKDNRQLIEYFKKLVIGAYGEKSLDGRHFRKSEELRRDFECSAAYSKIFMELATDEKAAADFVNGIIPKSIGANNNSKFIPVNGSAPK